MKRKTNKKSGIIAAVVGLSAVSLVSVGFASWVMSGGDSAAITDGKIQVETVDDNRFLIYKTAGDQNAAHRPLVDYGNDVKGTAIDRISFGIDDSTNTLLNGKKIWLTAGGIGENAPKYENLSATVSFYVANLETTDTGVPKAELSVNDNAAGGWAKAVNAGYVAAAPTTLTCAIGDDTVDEGGFIYRQVTASIEFAWGEHFTVNNQVVNPYVYYNYQTYSVEASNDAKDELGKLAEYLNNVSFTVAITTTVPQA